MPGPRSVRLLATVALAVALASCGGAGRPSAQRSQPPPRRCAVREGTPDPRCTPGATDPAVTQATIHRTICDARWLRTAPRLSPARAGALERRQLPRFGYYAGHDPALYEEDALIPVDLGGAGTDPRNLWPQARAPAPAAAQKDQFERFLHDAVCSGATTLAAARRTIGRRWRQAYLETTS